MHFFPIADRSPGVETDLGSVAVAEGHHGRRLFPAMKHGDLGLRIEKTGTTIYCHCKMLLIPEFPDLYS